MSVCKSMSTPKTDLKAINKEQWQRYRDSTEFARRVIQGVCGLRQGEKEGAKRACDATDGTAGHEIVVNW